MSNNATQQTAAIKIGSSIKVIVRGSRDHEYLATVVKISRFHYDVVAAGCSALIHGVTSLPKSNPNKGNDNLSHWLPA